MALTTAQDWIYIALRKCGEMRPGYLPSPELLADALTEWGSLFDSWAAERTMGFSIPQYTYAVTGAGSQSNGNGYLIGPTAHAAGNIHDFQGPRPNSIVRANLVMTNVGPQPVYIPIRMISAEEWAALAIRQIPAINVTNLAYYDPQFPNGVFNVFPPLNGNSIELFTWQALAVPATLGSSYSAPPGYQDAIIYSLASRLWPMCVKNLMPNKASHAWLSARAYEACQKVRAVNRPIPTLRNDSPRGNNGPAGFYDPNCSWTGEPY